jgi:hypothetical protein
MLSNDDERFLTRLYHATSPDRPLEPTNPYYVDISDDRYTAAVGHDNLHQVERRILRSDPGSTFWVTGVRGSGKSTQLLGLKAKLAKQGWAPVIIDAAQCLNLDQPVEIIDFLLALAGAVPAAAAEEGLIKKDPTRQTKGEKFKEFIARLDVQIDLPWATIDVDKELKNATFLNKIREQLANSVGALSDQVNQLVTNTISEIKAQWVGQQAFAGFVVLIDSLEHLRCSNARSVINQLLVQNEPFVRLPGCYTVITVPPFTDFTNARPFRCVNVKITDRTGHDCPEGLAFMRAVLTNRMPGGKPTTSFISDTDLDNIIRQSGGSIRDFLRIIQELNIEVDQLPARTSEVNSSIAEIRQTFLPLTSEERKYLRAVQTTHSPNLNTNEDWDALADLMGRHLILRYQNGEEWYGIHPLIRDDVMKHNEN